MQSDSGFGSQFMAIDAAGNIYTSYVFEQTMDMDPGPGVTNLTSAGLNDIYIRKMDANGNLLWAKGIGGANYDEPRAIDVDSAGNVYLTGLFAGTVDFDPGPGIANFASNPVNTKSDVYALKLDSNGDFQWAVTLGDTSYDVSKAIHANALGEVFVAGMYSGTVDFDPGPGVLNLSTPQPDYTHRLGFLLKLDASGNLEWVRSIGQSGGEECQSFDIAANGDLLVAGTFVDSVDMDPGPGTTLLTSSGDPDLYLMRLDPQGNFIWAVPAVSSNAGKEVFRVVEDPFGHIYVAGNFSGVADFDPDTTDFSLTSGVAQDVYYQKLNAQGQLMWAGRVGGAFFERLAGFAVDQNGYLYATGSFFAQADFDPGPGFHWELPLGSADIFLQKITPNGQLRWVHRFGGNTSDWDLGTELIVDANNRIITSGFFGAITDFDHGSGQTLLDGYNGSGYIAVYDQCSFSGGSIADTSCGNYVSPSGDHIWTTSGLYLDTLQSSQLCDSILSIQLSVFPALDTTVSVVLPSLVSNATNVTYQWYTCGTGNQLLIIPGETNPTFFPSASGSYAVVVSDSHCTGTSPCINYTRISTDPPEGQFSPQIVPHPVNGAFKLDFSQTLQAFRVRIYDLQGALLKEYSGLGEKEIDMDFEASPGIYFLEIMAPEGQARLKFLKTN
ncbi:MAG: SBBP repeat-containing protein [Bacteroidota bacterium]